MRGTKNRQPNMFYAIDVESRIQADHPLRAIKTIVDQDLARMNRLFNQAYANEGRPSVAAWELGFCSDLLVLANDVRFLFAGVALQT